jgi:hypothetical protein
MNGTIEIDPATHTSLGMSGSNIRSSGGNDREGRNSLRLSVEQLSEMKRLSAEQQRRFFRFSKSFFE